MGLALAGNLFAADTNQTLVSTTSASRQFTVHASSATVSAALCAFAENIKRDWLQQLALADAWRDPIVFIVREPGSSPVVRMDVFQVEPRLKYQITCIPPLDEATLAAATVRGLCAEIANRDQPRSRRAAYVTAPIPLWLAEGLAQLSIGRPDQLISVLRRSASGGRPQPVRELMETTALPEEDAGRGLYRANAWLLTGGLLRLPDGPRKMLQLLHELGARKVVAAAIDSVYGDEILDWEAWWRLQQTRGAELSVAEDLSAAETAQRLDAILREPSFETLWRSYQEPWLPAVLEETLTALERLRLRAHPLYRPVLARYINAVIQLHDVKLSRFRRGVAAAARQRAAVEQQIRQIQDILDRAESTYRPDTNAFREEFKTLDRLEQFEKQRRNPISDYLDKFDQ